MGDMNERLDALRGLIQSREFLEGKGLSNEVNIRIFCYDPKNEMAVRHFTEKLVTDQSLSCHLIENITSIKCSFQSAMTSASQKGFPRKRRKRESSLFWIK